VSVFTHGAAHDTTYTPYSDGGIVRSTDSRR
jgi:hypothetical protein